MSQEKVELRKAQKGNTKANVKKEKRKKVLITIIAVVVAVIAVVWIGVSIFFGIKEKASTAEKQVNLDAVQEYMKELDTEVNGSGEESKTE